MKKWILPLLVVLAATTGCSALRETSQERQARVAREAREVRERVEAGDFKVNIDRMYPRRGSSRTVSTYSVTVRDGVLDSHLPFIGQAWQTPYGGGHALNFKADIGNYQVQPLKDGYEVTIRVKTDEDEHRYTFQIFDNGSTSLTVWSGNRDQISYSGTMEFGSE